MWVEGTDYHEHLILDKRQETWITATWAASCPKSVCDKRLDQRIASNTWKSVLCMWGQQHSLHEYSLRSHLLLINSQTTQNKGQILIVNSGILPIFSPVETREGSQRAYIMLLYAWATMFTPQYGCQLYHPLPAQHTLTLLQQDRTNLAAREWGEKQRVGGRKNVRERKCNRIQGLKHIQVFYIKQQPASWSSKPRTSQWTTLVHLFESDAVMLEVSPLLCALKKKFNRGFPDKQSCEQPM